MPRKRPRAALVRRVKAIKAARAVQPAGSELEGLLLSRLREMNPAIPRPEYPNVSEAIPKWRRIYVNDRNMVFVSGVSAMVDRPTTFYFRLFHLDLKRMNLSHFASALLTVQSNGILISAVSRDSILPTHLVLHKSSLGTRGFRVGLPVLDEAERLARNRHLPRLLLNTNGRSRINYYKTFGFRVVHRTRKEVEMMKELQS